MAKFEFTNNLISFNKHNSLKKIPRIINDLNSGKSLNKYDKKLNNLRDSQNFLLKDSINLRDNKLEIFSFRKD